MVLRRDSLYSRFQPDSYALAVSGKNAIVKIKGKKMPPPSKRLTLHQKDLKIIAASIVSISKSGTVEHEIARISRLSSFQEVRLHTNSLLYPGKYVITLEYDLLPELRNRLKTESPNRELLPCVDEPAAWAQANFEFA